MTKAEMEEPGYAEGKKEAERLAGLKAKKDALRAQGISVRKPVLPAAGSVEDRLAEQVMKYRHDPARFVKFAYPWGEEGELKDAYGPRIWQGDILDEIGDHLRSERRFKPLQLSVASGHGIGKTALIAWITNWAMSTCVDCRVIVTAGTGKQLDTKTWPEVIKWFKLGINGHWFDTKAESICARDKVHERLWRADAITWSENNVDPFAGLHNKGKRIVVVFDEASSVADKIWEVTSGALTDEGTEIIWIAFGNPTQNVGMFRECFGRFKHRWVTKQIDSRMVDGTNKELFSQWVEDYGEDSDYVRVRVKGEFPRAGSTQFISGEVVEGARKRTVAGWEKDWKILVADVARFGDDMTVFGVRQGDKFHKVEKHRGLDTMQTAMRLEARIREENPRLVVIDGDGLGAGVVDHVRLYMGHWFLTHAPSRLVEFHGGSGPRDGDMYYNRRAECWGLMRKWLETGDIPDDSEMAMDLTGPVYYFSMHNQIQLERKEDMKKRGLASPDLGDCLAMSFVESPAARTREEKLVEEIAAVSDPYEQHWMRLKETEHRMRIRQPKNWWEG